MHNESVLNNAESDERIFHFLPILMTGGNAETTASRPARPKVAAQLLDRMAHGARPLQYPRLVIPDLLKWKNLH